MIKIISKPRRGGKTYDVIKRCAEEGGHILVPNQAMAHMTHKMAHDMGFNIPMPITALEFREGKYFAAGVKSLHADNVELILQAMSKVPIKTISINYQLTDPKDGEQ